MSKQQHMTLDRKQVQELDALVQLVDADGKIFDPWEELAGELAACHHPLDVVLTAMEGGRENIHLGRMELMNAVNSAIAHVSQVAQSMQELSQKLKSVPQGTNAGNQLPSWWEDLQTWVKATTNGLRKLRESIY